MGSSPKHKKFNLDSGRVGAIAELIVAVDLAKKGYEVFRSLSPACSSDLVAIKNKTKITIEVRTGKYKSQNRLTKIFKEYENIVDKSLLENLSYPKNNMKSSHFAIVTFIDEKVHYRPNLKV
jgi:hypothetical protein